MDYRALKRRCQMEQEIISRIYQDNQATCHFAYEPVHNEVTKQDGWILTLVTCNPAHNELFTMYTSDPQETQEKCLDQAILYLNEIKNKASDYFSYLIKWVARGDTTAHESYFCGVSFMDIIGKFYENKDESDFIIREVKLMPMS